MTNAQGQRKGPPGWLMAVTMGLGLIGAGYFAWERLAPAPDHASSPAAEIVVRYHGRNWIPIDPALATVLPDEQMVMVGQDARYTLWANTMAGVGGGGAAPPAGLETGPYHRIWVRLDDGRYLPMRWLVTPSPKPR